VGGKSIFAAPKISNVQVDEFENNDLCCHWACRIRKTYTLLLWRSIPEKQTKQKIILTGRSEAVEKHGFLTWHMTEKIDPICNRFTMHWQDMITPRAERIYGKWYHTNCSSAFMRGEL
jgi:hypothetical protein